MVCCSWLICPVFLLTRFHTLLPQYLPYRFREVSTFGIRGATRHFFMGAQHTTADVVGVQRIGGTVCCQSSRISQAITPRGETSDGCLLPVLRGLFSSVELYFCKRDTFYGSIRTFFVPVCVSVPVSGSFRRKPSIIVFCHGRKYWGRSRHTS